MANMSSMAAMMGNQSSAASVPTQSFNASNILGTPVPVVGDNKGRTNYTGSVGQNIPKSQVVIVAVALIGIGYLVYHFNFEK